MEGALAESCAPSYSNPVGRGCPLLRAACTEGTRSSTQDMNDACTELMPWLEKQLIYRRE